MTPRVKTIVALGGFLLFVPKISLAQTNTPQLPAGPPPGNARPTPPTMDQMTNIPYFTLRDGMSSTLTLNNVSPSATHVAVTIYNMEGKAQVLKPITLEPHSFEQIELSDVVVGEDFSSGSIEVSYNGIMMGVTCQVSVSNLAKRVSFESREQDMMDFNSSKLNGILSLPKADAEGYLAITNTGQTKVTTQIAVGLKQRTVDLYPHQSRLLNLAEEFGLRAPAAALVKLQHDGLPGEIITSGFVLNVEDGYSSSFAMVDPAIMRSSHLAGAHLRAGAPDPAEGFPEGTQFHSPLLLANTTSSPVKAHVLLDYTAKEKVAMTLWNHAEKSSRAGVEPEAAGTEERFSTVNAGDLMIAPGAVARVELSETLEKLGSDGPVSEAGVDVDYDAPPGALIGHLVSVDQSGDYSFEVPVKDATAMNEMMEGIYPWTLENGNNTVLHLKNTTTQPVKALLTLTYHNNGTLQTYQHPEIDLEPYQAIAIDIQKLKINPDLLGHVIPAGVMSGQAEWRQEEPYTVIGRAEQTNLKEGVARSFSCGQTCCDYYYETDYLSPSSMTGAVGGSGLIAAERKGFACSGTNFGPVADPAQSWGSSNTAVATVSASGSSGGSCQLVGAGTAGVSASLRSIYYVTVFGGCQSRTTYVGATASVKSCLYTIQPQNGYTGICDDLKHTANFQIAVSPSSDQQACAINSGAATLTPTGGNLSVSNLQYNSTYNQVSFDYIATKPTSGVAGTIDLIATIYFNHSSQNYKVENYGDFACQ